MHFSIVRSHQRLNMEVFKGQIEKLHGSERYKKTYGFVSIGNS